MTTNETTKATETKTYITATTTDQGEAVSVYRTASGFAFEGTPSQVHAVKSLPRGAAALPWGTIGATVMRTVRQIAKRNDV